MIYLGLILFLLSCVHLYKLTKKNSTYWRYKEFHFRNLNLIFTNRSNFSSKLTDLTKAIELYKQTQNGYFLKEDIDYSSIQNMKKFMELYDLNKKNHKEAENSYCQLRDAIDAEYKTLIGKYHQDVLKTSYDELVKELVDFDNAIISLYEQADTFMDAIKSIYDGVLNDKIILKSLLEEAISNEEYLEAAELRDLLKIID